jgi:hypothetical protein
MPDGGYFNGLPREVGKMYGVTSPVSEIASVQLIMDRGRYLGMIACRTRDSHRQTTDNRRRHYDYRHQLSTV